MYIPLADRIKTLKEHVTSLSTGEIRQFRARYCGAFNELLSIRTYECQIDLKWIDELLQDREFEDAVLISE